MYDTERSYVEALKILVTVKIDFPPKKRICSYSEILFLIVFIFLFFAAEILFATKRKRHRRA